MSDRIEILASKTYLTRTDIAVMLNVSRSVANRIFAEADRIDSQMEFRAYPTRVRKSSVEKASGTSCLKILKELKNAEST